MGWPKDGVGPAPPPTSTFGWSASNSNARSCGCVPPAPVNASARLRLWVPSSQRLEALNRNVACSGCAFTAPIVAKSAGVSTPFIGTGSRLVATACIGISSYPP